MSRLAEPQEKKTDPFVQKASTPIALRCMVYKRGDKGYLAECIDLDLIACAKTSDEASASLKDALGGYLKVALSGDPQGLVPRPSPLSHRIRYYFFRVLACIKGTHRNFKLFRWSPTPSYC